MMMVAATPFAGLLELFAAVPVGIIAAICGVECASVYRRNPWRPWRR